MEKGRRTCKKCQRDFWLEVFREYAPGKHRHTCRSCENARQAEYQRAYEQRKREKTVAKAAEVKLDALAEVLARLKRIEDRLDRLEKDQLEDLLS